MYSKETPINQDHVIEVLKSLQSLPITDVEFKDAGDESAMYFKTPFSTRDSYFNVSSTGSVYFLSLALADGYDYYITHWREVKRSIITLMHDEFGFDDDVDESRTIFVPFYETEEEHFQETLVSKKLNYVYEICPTVIDVLTKLNKLYKETK